LEDELKTTGSGVDHGTRFPDSRGVEWIVLALLAIIIGLLLFTIIRLSRSDYTYLADRMANRSRNSFEVLRPCPLCGELLRRGQTVHSHVFSGGEVAQGRGSGGAQGRPKDYLSHMFGCPYCYPANERHPRVCPVCRAQLEAHDYVIARYFEKPDKKHVHVLGCTRCRERKKA
jgi:hypothetical protein